MKTKKTNLPRPVKLSALSRKMGAFIHAEHIPGPRLACLGGARNEFRLVFEHGEIMQSYRAICGAKIGETLFLSDFHDYSKTTCVYVSRWCGLNPEQRRRGLKNGSIRALIA